MPASLSPRKGLAHEELAGKGLDNSLPSAEVPTIPEKIRPAALLRLRTFCLNVLSWVLVYFAIAVALQWRNGAYHTGFGAYPDEPSHFVTGLMAYKYLTTSLGHNPMTFAERFYAHYPAVGFGHWPPLFYGIQALWGVPFGLSRTSALLLMAFMAAICAVLVAESVRLLFGRFYGVIFGVIFIVLPLVQLHTAAIMAELPLTLFTFVTVMMFIKLIYHPRRWLAWWCGIFMAAAILVKGDGWALLAMAACVPFLTEQPLAFARRFGWLTIAPVVAVCVPYMLLTIGLATDGFEQLSPTWRFVRRALYEYAGDHVRILGIPLMILAITGVVLAVIGPAVWKPTPQRKGVAANFAPSEEATASGITLMRRFAAPVWICNLVVIASVYLFHALVPTSLESRKVFMSIPSLLVLAAAGVKGLSDLASHAGRIPKYGIPLAIGIVVAGISLARPQSVFHRNMGDAAQIVLDEPNLDHSAVLVASTAYNENEELSFVAELAARERANFRHAVIRGGKLIADSSWMGTDYKLRYTDPEQVHSLLDSIPVSCAVLYIGSPRPNSHARLVKEAVLANPEEWDLIRSQKAAGGVIDVFAVRTRPTGPVRLPNIDLHRKLGRSISADF